MDDLKSAQRPGLSPSRKEKTSVVLKDVLRSLPDTEVSIGSIVTQLRRRSFGGILILLAALGILPGISIFAGIVMIATGAQMLAGFRSPLFPKFIRDRQIDSSLVIKIGEKCISMVEKFERFVKPRYVFLTAPPVPNLIGLVVMALGLVIIVPLPFSNVPPAIALLMISAGLLEHDGILIAVGLIAAAIALTIGWFIGHFAIDSLILFINDRYG